MALVPGVPVPVPLVLVSVVLVSVVLVLVGELAPLPLLVLFSAPVLFTSGSVPF